MREARLNWVANLKAREAGLLPEPGIGALDREREEKEAKRRRRGDGRNSGIGVVTSDLAEVIEEWIELHERDRPREAKGYVESQEFISGIQYIEDHTGLSYRLIYRIRTVEYLTTDIGIADTILQALDLPHKLHDGSIRLIERKLSRMKTDQNTPRFKNNEEWLEYLDQIGCRR